MFFMKEIHKFISISLNLEFPLLLFYSYIYPFAIELTYYSTNDALFSPIVVPVPSKKVVPPSIKFYCIGMMPPPPSVEEFWDLF